MIKPINRKSFLVVVLMITALWLRVYRVEMLNSATSDERLWLMAGVSILKEGIPTAWTIGWPQHRWDKYWEASNGVVTPWLDHPPLFALLMGGWSILMGVDDIDKTNQAVLRLPMVAISVVTIFITWLLAKRMFNEQAALFVLAVYTFFPTDLVASRFILPEHAVPLLLMLGIWAWLRSLDEHDEKNRKHWLVVLLAVCFAGPLLKLLGVIVPMTLILLAFLERQYRTVIKLIGVSVLSLGAYLLYAWFYSWEVFVGAQTAHLQRPQSFDHFWSFFKQLSAGNVLVTDPTMIVGWAGLFLILAGVKDVRVRNAFFAPLLSISFFFLYVASVENYDWYKYPIYPFMAIGTGWLFYRIYKGDFWYLFFFLPLLAQMMQNSALIMNQAQRRLLMLATYGVAVVPVLIGKKTWQQNVFICLLLLLFLWETVWYLHIIGAACWLSNCFPAQFRV